MQRLSYFVFFIFIAVSGAIAQDFNYVHYDTRDGLAGSTVYDMCQDKEGFIWFATENGLSRYDGSHFKNYTVKDGLPDNEVLRVFADSKGRVWIGSFAKQICYYFQGKIYNKANTTLLAKIDFGGALLNIWEDGKGGIMLGDRQIIYQISVDNTVSEVINNHKRNALIKRYAVDLDAEDNFIINDGDSAFKFKNGKLHFQYKISAVVSDRFFSVKRPSGGAAIFLESPDTRITQTFSHINTVYVSTVNGSWSIDTLHNKLDIHFLPGKRVSRTINDNEGNIWFSTMGEGVYKLSSIETRTIAFAKAGATDNSEIFSLTGSGNQVVGGLGFSKAVLVDKNLPPKILDYAAFTGYSSNNLSTNRLFCSKTLSTGDVVLGFDAYLVKVGNDGKPLVSNKLVAIKSVDEIDGEHILVGMYSHAYKVRSDNLAIVDTIWSGRCTKVLFNKGKYYIGTINGLYEVAEDKTYKYLGDIHPSLKRRIADMKVAADGALWIATNDAGLLAYKEGKILPTLKDSNGLSSNICKSLYLEHDFLWVGTNKGLNRIDVKSEGYPMVKYSSSDGLPSDIINALYVQDSTVWVGTPAGLTYFNEKKISHTSLCKLRMLSVSVSGKQLSPDTIHSFSYKNNNIRFEYVAISFKSAGDIVYHYKLSGLDTGWQQTRETVLDYPSLPAGDYHFQLYAVNKFGVKSSAEDFVFTVAAPFWGRWWFYVLVLLATITFTGLLVNSKNKSIQQRLEEKNSFQKQFAALEQQALQAQMNPHFIFNCLNSIQQYILTNDKEKANEYLTGFATLIRQTLDNSGKKSVTISEEVRYLSSYLEMEMLRFGDSFSWQIKVDESVVSEFTWIPALLLQPYVENALRHGIRYKEQDGKVEINFSIQKEMLVCVVEDNGIGRKKAGEMKGKQHIEYQSKGMTLTEKRIKLLNKAGEQQITVLVEDLQDTAGNDIGTRVTVSVPTLSNY